MALNHQSMRNGSLIQLTILIFHTVFVFALNLKWNFPINAVCFLKEARLEGNKFH